MDSVAIEHRENCSSTLQAEDEEVYEGVSGRVCTLEYSGKIPRYIPYPTIEYIG